MKKQYDFSLFTNINEHELLKIINDLNKVLHCIDFSETIDHLGNRLLPIMIDDDIMCAFWPDYWRRLKNEFKIFVCSTDKKYDKLRKDLSNSTHKCQITIVSTISAAMASQIGVSAGVLVPFIAMCLLAMIRIGKEAFCSAAQWDIPLNIDINQKHDENGQ